MLLFHYYSYNFNIQSLGIINLYNLIEASWSLIRDSSRHTGVWQAEVRTAKKLMWPHPLRNTCYPRIPSMCHC